MFKYVLPALVSSPLTRSLVGFGLQIELNASPLLVLELAYPTQVCTASAVVECLPSINASLKRGKLSSFYNSIWYLGSVIGAPIATASVNLSLTVT